MESTQLLTLSMVTPKADLGFMLITPDLHNATEVEKRLSLSLGADVLAPVTVICRSPRKANTSQPKTNTCRHLSRVSAMIPQNSIRP